MDHVLDHLGVRDPRNRVSVHIDPERRDLHLGSGAAQPADAARDRERGEVLTRRSTGRGSRRIASDGRLEFRVADRGPGIDETLLRSPLPFTQGDPSMTRTTQGLGLGLFAAVAARRRARRDDQVRSLAPAGGPRRSSRSRPRTPPTRRPTWCPAPRSPDPGRTRRPAAWVDWTFRAGSSMDRASDYGSEGWGFDSLPARNERFMTAPVVTPRYGRTQHLEMQARNLIDLEVCQQRCQPLTVGVLRNTSDERRTFGIGSRQHVEQHPGPIFADGREDPAADVVRRDQDVPPGGMVELDIGRR